MARRYGQKGRPGVKTVTVQFRMNVAIRDRLWSKVHNTTEFIEQAITEKLDRESNTIWARQQEVLLIAGL